MEIKMKSKIEQLAKRIFYKEFRLDEKDFSSQGMFFEDGMVRDVVPVKKHKTQKKKKRYCATNLMSVK